MIKWQKNKISKKIKYFDYLEFDAKTIKKIDKIKKFLQGVQIVHLNATAKGGGVAELLNSQVAFEQSLGANSSWYSIVAEDDFFVITKKIHNLMHGGSGVLITKEKDRYLQVNNKLAKELLNLLKKNQQTIFVIHDPQPLAIIEELNSPEKCILRLHIDLRNPKKNVINFLRPYIKKYRYIVISSLKYGKQLQAGESDLQIITPAIDPLSQKNLFMTKDNAWKILRRFGLDPDKKLITQVSRFDAFKDPLGVVRSFKAVKRNKKDLQLVLAGFAFAKDDPEALDMYQKTKKLAGLEKDIHLFIDPDILHKHKVSNDKFISALYTASTVIIQNSKQEGFGLTITEAMWKKRAVIAGNAEGPRMQIINRKNGILVNSNTELSKSLVEVLDDESLRKKLGRAAYLSVRRNYLLPKYILSHLNLYIQIINGGR